MDGLIMKDAFIIPKIEVIKLEGKDILMISEPPVIGGDSPPPAPGP